MSIKLSYLGALTGRVDRNLRVQNFLVLGEATLGLQVADLIDLAEEKTRLSKEIEKLEKDISGIEKKLANEKFVSRAPPEIIEEQHTRKADACLLYTSPSPRDRG